MSCANIFTDNLLIAKRTSPQDGDIVVASINNKTTIRYFASDAENHILYTTDLHSSNAIRKLKNQIKILGVVTSIINNI